MRKRNFSWLMLIAIFGALALVASACSDDDDDSGGGDTDTTTTAAANAGDDGAGDGTGTTTADDGMSDTTTGAVGDLGAIDLTDIDIAVGSKDFTEQLVLGEILVQTFEHFGANVDNRVDLGGTAVARAALESGDIDVYPEYNGTGWTVHLGQEDPSFDSDQLTKDVSEMDLAENSIRWVGQSPFNDTYGFATGPDLTESNGGPFTLESMATYLQDNPDATVCLESEFPDRPDGLILFEDATGFEIPQDQIEILDTGIIYNETATGSCEFGEIFTTDGRIPALDLTIVEDDGVFIIYNVSITMRDELYQQDPEAFEAIATALFAPLDEETMADLNRRVSVDGEEASDVAADFLTQIGITG